MAYLSTEPITVIGGEQEPSPNNLLTEDDDQSSFIPPSSTWYDESHQHFVALLDKSFMIGTTTVDSNEVFFYQTYKLPDPKEKCFIPSSLYPIILPLRVCRRLSNKTKEAAPVRIPLLVKFSLDRTLLVLQLSDKILKIVVVQAIDNTNLQMMSIMSILPQSIIDGKQQQWIVNLTKEDGYIRANSSSVCEDGTRILPGGVIWSDHGGSSQDLIVITNTAVLFYKISIPRNQLAKSRTYTHTSDAFWYEKTTRTLLVATLSPNKLYLRTYFLRMNEKASATANYMPRLNLPPPDLLPLFHVSIENNDDNVDYLNNCIALVKLYNEPYCVVIQKVVSVYHLDKVGRCVQCIKTLFIPTNDDDSIGDYFVTALDNILCLHCKKRNVSYFYDVASESQDVVFQGEFIENCVDFYQKYQVLSPNLYLDPEHRGKIFIPHLDLKRISCSIPLHSPFFIPFLLRRDPSSLNLAHSLALYRLYSMIQTQTPLSIIKSAWMKDVVSLYARSNKDHNVVLGWDMEACIPLIFQCVLLPRQQNSTREDSDEVEVYLKACQSSSICPHPPCICSRILTQVQIIEHVLLPLAVSAIEKERPTNCDDKKEDELNFIADVACLFMDVLFRNSTPCCVALECLIVAIYWRLGYGNRALSFLSSCHSFCRRQISNEHNTADYHDNPMDAHYDTFHNDPIISHTKSTLNAVSSSDAILTFAKMLLIMATDVPLGGSIKTNDYHKNALINFSIDLMCFNSSDYQVVAKHLLDLGRVMEAIFVCTNGLLSQQQQQQRSSSPMRKNTMHDSQYMNHLCHSPCKGTEAIDFFNAAVDCATKMDDVGDRSRLFYYLYTFLCQYDSESISSYSSEKSLDSNREKSSSSLYSNATSVDGSHVNHDSDILTNAHVESVITPKDVNPAQASADSALIDESSAVTTKAEDHTNKNENVVQNYSPLAMSILNFPDDLFDGKGNSVSNTIRGKFGFPSINS